MLAVERANHQCSHVTKEDVDRLHMLGVELCYTLRELAEAVLSATHLGTKCDANNTCKLVNTSLHLLQG